MQFALGTSIRSIGSVWYACPIHTWYTSTVQGRINNIGKKDDDAKANTNDDDADDNNNNDNSDNIDNICLRP